MLDRSLDDRYDDAENILRQVALEDGFPTFLTILAYAHYLVETAPAPAMAA